MTSNYLTRRQVADALATTPRTLRRLERLGIGPQPARLGPRMARYPATAVAEFAAIKRDALSAQAEIAAEIRL